MNPLIIVGLCLMAACVVNSGIDMVRTMRKGRDPERRMRSFLISAGLLIAGGIFVVIGVVNS